MDSQQDRFLHQRSYGNHRKESLLKLARLLMPDALLFVCFQEELRCMHFLWQLFHIDHDLTKARQRMAKESKAMEAAARSGILAEKEIDAKKKGQASFHLERIKLERHLKRRRTESDQKVTACWALGASNCPSTACACSCVACLPMWWPYAALWLGYA